MEAADNVPEPTLRRVGCVPLVAVVPFMVIAPAVKVWAPLKVRLFAFAPALKVMVPIVWDGETFSETALPAAITTLSVFPTVFPGKVEPLAGQPAPVIAQLAFVPQFGVAPTDVKVQVAACAGVAGIATRATITIINTARVR